VLAFRLRPKEQHRAVVAGGAQSWVERHQFGSGAGVGTSAARPLERRDSLVLSLSMGKRLISYSLAPIFFVALLGFSFPSVLILYAFLCIPPFFFVLYPRVPTHS